MAPNPGWPFPVYCVRDAGRAILPFMVTDTAITYPEFTPGRGKQPPYLAGRNAEQRALLELLARLRKGEGADRDVVVIGPRGNGKTALLRWFERQCAENGTGAQRPDVVWLTPDDIESADKLTLLLTPPDGWREYLPDEIEVGPATLGKLKWRFGSESRLLTQVLIDRCKKKPLVLLLDEAHTLDPKIGRVLLNTSQKVSSMAPFLLVLGGTPGLEQRLNEMKATFWSRSQILGIERLDPASTRAALVEPFRKHGIAVEESVVDHVIADSQGYPYFLQCWGEALTGYLREHGVDSKSALGVIKGFMTDVVRSLVEDARTGHYELFRRQIHKAGLQPLAAALTEAYAGADTLEEHELNAVVRTYLDATGKPTDDLTVDTQVEALAGFGYVWRPPAAKAIWHAGIPSLMQHVLDVELKVRPQRALKETPAP